MTGYCMGCGARIAAERGLCSLCGDGVRARIEVLPTVYRPQALAPGEIDQVPDTGRSVWRIVWIVLGLATAIPIVLIGTGLVVVPLYRLPVWLQGMNGVITLPAAAKGDADELDDMGLPVYPGAQRGKGGLSMKQGAGSILSAVYLAYAPVEEVTDFYLRRLGPGVSETDSPDGSELKQIKSDNDVLTITLTRGSGAQAGKTQIMVLETKLADDGLSGPPQVGAKPGAAAAPRLPGR